MTKRATGLLAAALTLGLTAASASAAKIVVDFGQGGNANNLSATTSNGLSTISYNRVQVAASPAPVLANLQDTAGNPTGIGLTRTSATEVGSNNNGLSGTLSGAAAAIFPDVVGQTFGYVGPNGTVNASYSDWTFSSLDASGNTKYTFDIFSARATAGDRTTNFTLTGLNTGTGSINPCNNTSGLVHIADITPDASGNIVLRYSNATSAGVGYGYLNAVQVTTSAVPEPASLAVLGLSSVLLMSRRRARA
jgi:hypothetical protein